jgi:hypothetical protein
MIKITLIMGLILSLFCGLGASTISDWRNVDHFSAVVYGGEILNINGPMAGTLHINESGVEKTLDTGISVQNAKDITVTSTTDLILVDENGKEYTTSMNITNSLSQPEEFNVVLSQDGDIKIKSNNLGAPKTEWRTILEFPEDLDLQSFELGSDIDLMLAQDLESIDSYCADRGIGYTAGCTVRYTDSNEDLGIGCEWGEKEKITIGSEP